jgi:hypothetical protein
MVDLGVLVDSKRIAVPIDGPRAARDRPAASGRLGGRPSLSSTKRPSTRSSAPWTPSSRRSKRSRAADVRRLEQRPRAPGVLDDRGALRAAELEDAGVHAGLPRHEARVTVRRRDPGPIPVDADHGSPSAIAAAGIVALAASTSPTARSVMTPVRRGSRRRSGGPGNVNGGIEECMERA